MSFPNPLRATPIALATALALAWTASCGPKSVQLYEGAKLPNDQVTVLYTNKHLDITVDRNYTVPPGEISTLHRLELPAGHHVAEVRCPYTDDVQYHRRESPKGEAPEQNPQTPAQLEKVTISPVIALTVDGDSGNRYKPRVHFSQDEAGVRGCRVKIFNVTNEPGGEKIDFY